MRYVWLAAVVCSLALGAWSLRGRVGMRVRVPALARASSDAILAPLKLEKGGESLRQALARVPEKDAVVFVGPGENPELKQTLFTVSLLAWPRQVGGLSCQDGTGEMRVPLDADQKVTAVVFFRWDPGTAAAERLAPDLALVRIPPRGANQPWSSFCSSPRPPSF